MGPPHALLTLTGAKIKHGVPALMRSLGALGVFCKDFDENAGYSVTLAASNQTKLYMRVCLTNVDVQNNVFFVYTQEPRASRRADLVDLSD